MDDGILISQKIYVEDILKWLKMESSSTFVSHCKGIKDEKKSIEELVNTIYFKGKLESLCYLTFIIPAIVCGVGIIGQFMKKLFDFARCLLNYNMTKKRSYKDFVYVLISLFYYIDKKNWCFMVKANT